MSDHQDVPGDPPHLMQPRDRPAPKVKPSASCRHLGQGHRIGLVAELSVRVDDPQAELGHAGDPTTLERCRCPVTDRRTAQAHAHALARELVRRPDNLIVITSALADSPGSIEERLTVEELARQSLARANCASPEADVLRAALG
jgi:hypothetical protein